MLKIHAYVWHFKQQVHTIHATSHLGISRVQLRFSIFICICIRFFYLFYFFNENMFILFVELVPPLTANQPKGVDETKRQRKRTASV